MGSTDSIASKFAVGNFTAHIDMSAFSGAAAVFEAANPVVLEALISPVCHQLGEAAEAVKGNYRRAVADVTLPGDFLDTQVMESIRAGLIPRGEAAAVAAVTLPDQAAEALSPSMDIIQRDVLEAMSPLVEAVWGHTSAFADVVWNPPWTTADILTGIVAEQRDALSDLGAHILDVFGDTADPFDSDIHAAIFGEVGDPLGAEMAALADPPTLPAWRRAADLLATAIRGRGVDAAMLTHALVIALALSTVATDADPDTIVVVEQMERAAALLLIAVYFLMASGSNSRD